MKRIFDNIALRLKEWKYEVVDIQVTDHDVGIFNGWIVYKDPKGIEYEIDYDGFLYEVKTLQDLMKYSTKCKE